MLTKEGYLKTAPFLTNTFENIRVNSYNPVFYDNELRYILMSCDNKTK